jgi:hypothetical protein
MTRRELLALVGVAMVAACVPTKPVADGRVYQIEAWIEGKGTWWPYPGYTYADLDEALIAAKRLSKYYHRAQRVVQGDVVVGQFGEGEWA